MSNQDKEAVGCIVVIIIVILVSVCIGIMFDPTRGDLL
jgi:hypothetical protein